MAVFTSVRLQEAAPFIQRQFNLSAASLSPIAEGIENTNYLLRTEQGNYVFTVFEVWDAARVDYYAALMRHLAASGAPVPAPLFSHHEDGKQWGGKPCLLTPFVEGDWRRVPTAEECRHMGATIGVLHSKAAGFAGDLPNPRGAAWRRQAAAQVRDKLPPHSRALLDDALACDARFSMLPMPSTACHCDLFRNNVLWRGDHVAGVIDFYFGGEEVLIFDLAVCACDWCFNDDDGVFDGVKLAALLDGYESKRALCALESLSFSDALTVAALRFWLSRLYDWHFPRRAELLSPHNPERFEHILWQVRQQYPPQKAG